MPVAVLLSCALTARAVSATLGAGDTLFEVPARFVSGCPIISLDLASELKGMQPLDFVLDSGATRSVLLNADEGRERAFDPGRRGLLIPGQSTIYAGIQDFAAPNVAQFNRDLINRLRGFHVEGILGADFLTTHDALIDYGARRVFLSRTQNAKRTGDTEARWTLVGSSHPRVAGRPTNGVLDRHRLLDAAQSANVSFVVNGRRAYVIASLAGNAARTWRMRLDTWATRSTVPSNVATELKRTGRSELVTTADATFSAVQVEASLAIAADISLNLAPLATDATESVLGSDAFKGQTILLQFGSARFRLWPESVMAAFSGST